MQNLHTEQNRQLDPGFQMHHSSCKWCQTLQNRIFPCQLLVLLTCLFIIGTPSPSFNCLLKLLYLLKYSENTPPLNLEMVSLCFADIPAFTYFKLCNPTCLSLHGHTQTPVSRCLFLYVICKRHYKFFSNSCQLFLLSTMD